MSQRSSVALMLGVFTMGAGGCAIDTREIENGGTDPGAAAGGTKTTATGGAEPGTGGSEPSTGGSNQSSGGGTQEGTGGDGPFNPEWPCDGLASYADPLSPDSWLLDDMEHPGDFAFVTLDGRQSSWLVEHDGSAGTNTSPDGFIVPFNYGTESLPEHGNLFGASGYEIWGAVANLSLNEVFDPNSPFYLECAHDLSGWTGIAFDITATPGHEDQEILFGMITEDELPLEFGGRCVEDCSNSHLDKIYLEASWQTIEIPFAGLDQYYKDPEQKVPFDPSKAVRVEFIVERETTVEFIVDNLRLY